MSQIIDWNAEYSNGETYEDALVRIVNEMYREGVGGGYLDKIADIFGTTRMSINKKLSRLRKESKVGRYVALNEKRNEKPLICVDKRFAPKDVTQNLLRLVIEGNALLNEADVRQEEVFPEYQWKGWTGLVIGGDWHFEHYRTDTKAIIEMLKEIGQEKHLWYGFNGDAVDVLRLRFMELENETLDIPIRRRYEIINYLFTLIPNTLFVTMGCHDNWLRTRAFYDIAEQLQKTIQGYYLGYGGTVNFKTGDVTYRIAAYHKFGFESQNNHFHPNYNYLKKIDASADIVAVAHRHDIVGISQVFWQDKDRVFIRSGSQQYKTEYAWREGFRGAINRYPMVLLNGTERRMICGVNYREGIPYLRYLNKEYAKHKKSIHLIPRDHKPIGVNKPKGR